MKKLGIDGRLITQTGVGVYTYNFLTNLQKILPSNFSVNVYLRKQDWNVISFRNPQIIKKEANFHWHTFQEQIGFLNKLYKDNLDLMHFTYFSCPILYRRPFISTIHDLTPILFKTGKASTRSAFQYYPKYFAMKRVMRSAVSHSSAVIVPTKSVKKQLLSFFGMQYDTKTYPIYEGINEQLKTSKENNDLKKKFDNPFFLYIGNFYPHKNIEGLIQAFLNLKTSPQLILVGPDDFFSARLFQLIEQLKQKERVTFYHNPSLSDMVFFYKHALALVHPSLSEGFGLTTIEAAYFGCPVIASDIPVFKEVLDREYLAFNPRNIQDMTDKLSFFLKKRPSFNLEEIRSKYSFEKMTRETLHVYKKHLSL